MRIVLSCLAIALCPWITASPAAAQGAGKQPSSIPAGTAPRLAATNAQLAALGAANVAAVVLRQGVGAPGDAPQLAFVSSRAPCPQNGGKGDQGSCVPAAGGGSWRAVFDGAGADAREFGAKGDGTADDAPALAACAAAAPRCLVQGIASFSTTLASPAPAGAKSVSVAGAQNVAVNGVVYIQGAGSDGALYIGTIRRVSGTTIEVSPELATAAAAGAAATGKAPISYRLAETLALPEGSDLEGVGFTPGWPPIGATLVCDLAVSPCIDKGALGTLPKKRPRNSATLKGIIQSRAAGPIPTGSVGILEDHEQEPLLEDVYATRDGTCIEYLSSTSNGNGLEAHADHIWTGDCSNTHVEVNGWPVVVIHDIKLGSGTGPEQNSNSYFLITGGPAGDVNAGPSTVSVDQFQAYGPITQSFVTFANCPNCAPIGGVVGHTGAGLFEFTHGHTEGICHVITTDNSVTDLINFVFTHSSAFAAARRCRKPDFFNIDPATIVDAWNISDNFLNINGDLTTRRPIIDMRLSNNEYRQARWIINGAAGSQVSVSGYALASAGRAAENFYLEGGPYVNLMPGTPMQTAVEDRKAAALLGATERGSLVITNPVDGGTAQYLLGGSDGKLIGATKPNWAGSATCEPRNGRQSVCFDSASNEFQIVNDTGRRVSYYWTPTLTTGARH